MVRLSQHVVFARIGTVHAAEVPRGVLLRLDAPVAAFVGPAVWRWLADGETAAKELPAESRAACVRAWSRAGLIQDSDIAEFAVLEKSQDGDLFAEGAGLGGALSRPVLAVGVSAACGFCAQLEADLAANTGILRDAQFGVLLAGDGKIRSFGIVPEHAVTGLAKMAERAAESGTPRGVVVAPGCAPVSVPGYDQVTAALVRLSGWSRNVVVEAPTSCSVNVMSGDVAVHPVLAGDRVIGVGLRGYATQDLAAYVADRSAGTGYAPPVLLVERSQNLFLVFRGGEMIARLKAVRDVEGLLDTILDGYVAAASSSAGEAGVPVLCGALLADQDGAVVLFPRSWMSELVKQQSRLRQVGWMVCPDLCVSLTSACLQGSAGAARLSATVHPVPTGSPDRWPPQTGLVREILVDPVETAGGRAVSTALLLAQVVNWVVRPATADQVHALAAAVIGVPVRTTSCPQLTSELTSAARRPSGRLIAAEPRPDRNDLPPADNSAAGRTTADR